MGGFDPLSLPPPHIKPPVFPKNATPFETTHYLYNFFVHSHYFSFQQKDFFLLKELEKIAPKEKGISKEKLQ